MHFLLYVEPSLDYLCGFVHLKGVHEREAAILWGMGKEKAMGNVVRKQKMGERYLRGSSKQLRAV